MAGKIGGFFLTVGLLMLIIFYATSSAGQPAYGMLVGGLVSAGLGFFLWWKNRQPPPPSEYFQAMRKIGSKKDNPKGKPGNNGKK